MTREKLLEQWETKVGNCEVTFQVLWHIAESLVKRDGPKTPVLGPLGIPYHPNEKANGIADFFYNTSSHLMTCVMKTMNDGRRL
jgi:hypothetical protein